MIYIVEIPHQRPASCWVATNEADFCARAALEQKLIDYNIIQETETEE